MSTSAKIHYKADQIGSMIRGPITAARYHQLRTQVVDDFGLVDFETIISIRKRQEKMIRRFKRGGLNSDLWRPLLKCDETGCRCGSAACWYGQHLLRLQLLPLILSPPHVHGCFEWLATWVDIITVEAGQLAQLAPVQCVETVREQLSCLAEHPASSVAAFGSFELSLNTELDGTAKWNIHAHLLVNDVAKTLLRNAAPNHPTASRVSLQVKPIKKSLPVVLQYCLKRFPQERRAYLAPTGNRRNDLPLRSKHQLEHDSWLLGLRLTDRLLIYGPTPP